jgi:hypothetical protein
MVIAVNPSPSCSESLPVQDHCRVKLQILDSIRSRNRGGKTHRRILLRQSSNTAMVQEYQVARLAGLFRGFPRV